MKSTSTTLRAFKRGTSLERSKWYMGMLLTNLAEASDTSGAFSLFEATLVPGTEPPPHVHSRDDELFYVLEGEFDVYVGKEVHGVDDPRAQWRVISPDFFAAVGVPVLQGRDFNDLDTKSTEPVVIVSQTLAQRMFPGQDAVGHHVYWTDPVLQFLPGTDAEKARFTSPHRIIGVAADVDDEHVVPEPMPTMYATFADNFLFGGHVFVHTNGNRYSLVTPVTHIIRNLSAEQPVEHAATLEEIRAKVLEPDRLNSLVFGLFAAVALAIAVVGVVGVLAFSVSARTREFGIRLALGSQPEHLLRSVVAQGAIMAAGGIFAGAAFGFAVVRVAGSYFGDLKMPGALPVIVSAFVLLGAAVIASMLPAARAARIDVIQALRSE